MKLTVISPPATFWGSFSDTAFPALWKYGYTLFLKDGETTVFKRVIYANGFPQSSVEIGYSWVMEVPPMSGFSNTGNTIDWTQGDAGLIALAEAHNIPYPEITYAEMKALLTYPSVIEKTDNVISRLFLNNVQQDISFTKPTYGGAGWVFRNMIGTTNKINVICLGNSLTYIEGSIVGGWPALLKDKLQLSYTNKEITTVNSGVGGAKLSDLLADFTNLVTNNLVNGAVNILIINEFVNEFISPSYTSEEANIYMEKIVYYAHKLGIITFVSTCPEMPEEVQPYSDDACDYLLLNNTYSDYLIDFRNYIGLDDTTNATYRTVGDVWAGAGVHLTDAGRELMAQCAYLAISAEINNFDYNVYANNVNILNTQILQLDNSTLPIDAQKPGLNDFEFGVHFYGDVTGDNFGAILQCGLKPTSATAKGFGIVRRNTERSLGFIMCEEAGGYALSTSYYLTLQHNILTVKRTGTNIYIEFKTIVDGVINIERSNNTINLIDFTPTGNWKLGSDLSNTLQTKVKIIKAWYKSDVDNFEYNFDNQYGDIIYDELNLHTINAIDLPTDKWDYTLSDIEPKRLTNGCIVWFDGDNYKITPLGVESTSGFTKVIEAPAGSGILKGLSNTYDGIKITAIETDATFDDIDAIVIPPKEDFRLDNSGDVIKDWVVGIT